MDLPCLFSPFSTAPQPLLDSFVCTVIVGSGGKISAPREPVLKAIHHFKSTLQAGVSDTTIWCIFPPGCELREGQSSSVTGELRNKMEVMGWLSW